MVKRNVLVSCTFENRNGGPIGVYMAPRNVLLLTFWLLAAAICVTYVAVRREPVAPGLSISAQHVDGQRLRDRPLGSWGPHLPRPVLSKEMPRTAIAKAPPLGSEQPTIKRFEKPKQRFVEKRTVPYFSEPSPVARAASRKRTQEALLGAEDEQLAPVRTTPKAGKPKPTAKLASARKKVIAEGVPRKSGFARRGRGRGLGLFALSGDFGRPTRY